jgi:hypothetical protein
MIMRTFLAAVLLAALIGPVGAQFGGPEPHVLWQSRDGRNWQPVGFFPSFDACQYARTLYTGVCLLQGQRP